MISEAKEEEVRLFLAEGCSARQAAILAQVSHGTSQGIANGSRRRAARMRKWCTECCGEFVGWRNESRCHSCVKKEYEPSPSEIAERAAEIRRSW